MAYIEIKIINGCKYRYERVSIRIGKIVKHTSKYLGPLASTNKKRNPDVEKKSLLEL